MIEHINCVQRFDFARGICTGIADAAAEPLAPVQPLMPLGLLIQGK